MLTTDKVVAEGLCLLRAETDLHDAELPPADRAERLRDRPGLGPIHHLREFSHGHLKDLIGRNRASIADADMRA